ncbi:MAG: DUF2007 domain-containing protein, partial [Saprospiraceae bacterium]|nr:DUF2007 domain-containing protein [Saprospiraceae bacterium]
PRKRRRAKNPESMVGQHTFRDDVRVVILRRFIHEAQANIYAARLHEAGIDTFISNANTGGMLPFIPGGFVMHVDETDLEEAQQILREMDDNLKVQSNLDYRNADLEDIEYEKAVYLSEQKMERREGKYMAFFIIVLVVILSALYAFFGGIKL